MFEFKIPEKPVDGFTMTYWHLSWSSGWAYIREVSATYHVNTKWDAYAPDRKGGVDIVDDWMISTKEDSGNWSPVGRVPGWSRINRGEEYAHDIFATRNEAIEESRKRYDKEIEANQKRIVEMRRLQSQFDTRIK